MSFVNKSAIKITEILGKIIRFFAKTFLVLLVLFVVLLTFISGYLGLKIIPIVDGYKETAYEKFESIGPNTFTEIGNTVIYDKNNEKIGEINIGNYVYADIEDVSEWVTKGYIAVEDKRFKVHNGVDVKGLLRATKSLISNRGEITQGGSTITQQVVKNNLLTQEKSFQRKFVEIFTAFEIEKKYTKQDIMEFYVNTCFYGNNCYGIETASRYYFNKSAKDLTPAEAALFVGISNNGSYYNTKTNMEAVLERWELVLGEMKEEGYLTKEQYEEALNTEFEFAYNRPLRVKESYQVSYAIYSATINLMEKDGFEFKYVFDNKEEYDEYKAKYQEAYSKKSDEIRKGGYTIYTSLDSEKQEIAQKAVDKALSKYTTTAEDGRYEFQGAAVIVNNETGYVEAIVGGRGTEDEFNRGYLAKRQPGSSIKPLAVYSVAFETGNFYPSLIMNDVDDPNDKYYPKNSSGGYCGKISMREAVGRSVNTIAYQTMKKIGARTALEYLAKMRFGSLSYLDNENTAIALGGFTYGVSPVEMAKGYSTIANMGMYKDNNCVIKIEYQNAGVIFEEDTEEIPVYNEDVAYMMIDCAKSVLYQSYGTATSRKLKNGIAFAKTGTTNSNKDIWFCGSTVYYSCAVWAGYDNPKSTGLYGSGLTGGIWKEIMDAIHTDLEVVDFVRPETVVDLDIDYKGEIAKYKTGVKDIFSQNVIDRNNRTQAEKDEANKIEKDDLLIEKIEAQINDVRYYIIRDTDALDYLRDRFSSIDTMIESVYQLDKKEELTSEFSLVKKSFENDLRNMESAKIREQELKDYAAQVEVKNSVIATINTISEIQVFDEFDLEELDKLYIQAENQIKKLTDKTEKAYYGEVLRVVKEDKETSIADIRSSFKEAELKEKEQELDDLFKQILQFKEKTDESEALKEHILIKIQEYKKVGGDSEYYEAKFANLEI